MVPSVLETLFVCTPKDPGGEKGGNWSLVQLKGQYHEDKYSF